MAIRLATFTRDTSDDGKLRYVRSWHVDTEAEIEEVVAANRSYNGVGALTDHAENWDPDTIEGGFRVDITFEGQTLNGPNSPERGRWSFRPSFEKEPIEKHPAIQQLIEFYDGQVDPETQRVTFPEVYWRGRNAEGPSRSNHWQATGNNNGAAAPEKNPLYGMDESGYLALTGTATVRYTTNAIASALERVGEVYESLPYNAPSAFEMDGRDWLKAPPAIEELGSGDDGPTYSVEETYLLSEKGGWPPTVYDFIEL